MASLEQEAMKTNHSGTGMPTFAGLTQAQRLQDARAQARAVILKYVPDFKFDVTSAQRVRRQVDVWIERNHNALADTMQKQQQSLPQALQLFLGNNQQVQQWVVANFTLAAAGMGPWDSGQLMQEVANPMSDFNVEWANKDYEDRISTFGLIVKMERDGEMQRIFVGPAAQANGFGGLPVWAIVVIVLGLAAIVASLYYAVRKLELNNQLMRELCLKAYDDGKRYEFEKCVDATRDLQLGDPLSSLAGQLSKTVVVLGGIYIGVRYGLPWAWDKIFDKDRKSQ